MLPAGEPFALGGQLMRAVLCTNVVYPVYTRGQYIRHNTPGRWWDSLYTWDSGFIGMGLAQFSARRGFDCLNAYLTPPGDDEAAFIHHGSLVPAQFYLFAELLNRTQSRALAEYCYPRLMQYYAFLPGRREAPPRRTCKAACCARGTTSTIPAAGTIIRPKRPSMSSGWKSAARLWSQQRTRYGAPASWPILRTCSPTGRTQTGWKRMRSVSPGRFRSTRGTRAPDTSGMCCTMNREGLPAFAGRFRREP